MDVKISNGAWAPKPTGQAPQKKTDAAMPFSTFLHAEATAAKSGPVRNEQDFSGQTVEEVFARALADRTAPDLDSLDDYMDWLIQH